MIVPTGNQSQCIILVRHHRMKYKEPLIFLAFFPGVLRIEFNDPYLKDMLEAEKVRTNFTCGTQI